MHPEFLKPEPKPNVFRTFKFRISTCIVILHIKNQKINCACVFFSAILRVEISINISNLITQPREFSKGMMKKLQRKILKLKL